MHNLNKVAWLFRHPGFRSRPISTCANVLAWQYRKFANDVTTVNLGSLKFEARTSDGIARLIAYFQSNADEMFVFMRSFLRPGDRFVDVGANIGTHSLLAATLVGPAGLVDAIEADPETCQLLNKNITNNEMTNIVVHNACVSNISGKATFNINRNSARNSLLVAGEKTIELELKRVDQLCEAGGIALLKIDVEGADYLALEGSSGLFQNNPPKAVIIERPLDTDKVEEFLMNDGYKLMDFDVRSKKLIPMHDKTENIYAIHHTGLERINAMLAVVH